MRISSMAPRAFLVGNEHQRWNAISAMGSEQESGMFTGWFKRFDAERTVRKAGPGARLTVEQAGHVVPDEQLSLVRLNDGYAEFVDRAFRLRGNVLTLLSCLCTGVVLWLLLFIVRTFQGIGEQGNYDGATLTLLTVVATVFMATAAFVLWRWGWGRDVFRYMYYPVRFDRVRQHVHVFLHNGPGGMMSFPFRDVTWLIGCGEQLDALHDLRGIARDADGKLQVFSVGHYYEAEGEARVRSLWAFIVTYMQGGSAALDARGVERRIDLSVVPSWRNCWRWIVITLGTSFVERRYLLAPIYYPLVTVLTAWRWLVLNTSRKPRWPGALFDDATPPKGAWAEPKLIGGE